MSYNSLAGNLRKLRDIAAAIDKGGFSVRIVFCSSLLVPVSLEEAAVSDGAAFSEVSL